MKNPGYKAYMQKIEILNYQSDPERMAVLFHGDESEGPNYVTVTVNLPVDEIIMMPYCAFIDTNNNPGLCNFLEQEGIAEPVKMNDRGELNTPDAEVMTVSNDWVTWPMYKFNKSKLKELGATGFEKYEQTYMEGISRKCKGMPKSVLEKRVQEMTSQLFPDNETSMEFGE